MATKPDRARVRPARLGETQAVLALMAPFNRSETIPWRPSRVGLALRRRVRTRGASALHLLVRPENHAARRPYERSGFARVPRLMLTKGLPRAR